MPVADLDVRAAYARATTVLADGTDAGMDRLDASAAALFEMIGSGKVEIEIGQTFPLAEARKAHEALESRATIGASLLIP